MNAANRLRDRPVLISSGGEFCAITPEERDALADLLDKTAAVDEGWRGTDTTGHAVVRMSAIRDILDARDALEQAIGGEQ